MAVPDIETRERYVEYAEYCVRLAKRTDDPESREILRSMATEWLKLADTDDHASEPN